MAETLTYEAFRRRLDEAPLSRSQMLAIATAFCIAAIDGYDVLSATFVAPALRTAWRLQMSSVGMVLASGLLGMALGSFLLAPLADLLGRRRLILSSLAVVAAGMAISSFAHALPTMVMGRVVAGFGIGGCVAVMTSLAAELTNSRWRALTFALITMGFPVGGALGGLLAAALLRSQGWTSVFMAGVAMTLLLIAMVATFLPESLAFLASKPSPAAVARINSILVNYGQPTVSALAAPVGCKRGYGGVFTAGQVPTTIWIVVVQLLLVLAFNFFISWLPQLVVAAGLRPSTGSLVSAVASAAGIVGGLTFGMAASGARIRPLGAASMILAGGVLPAMGFAPPTLAVLLVEAATAGFLLYAATTAFYAVLSSCFPDDAKASGIGLVLGLSRIGGAVAPALAGALLTAGLGRAEVATCFGLCGVTAGGLLLWRPADLRDRTAPAARVMDGLAPPSALSLSERNGA